jgi:Uma2 family endonuclease
MSVQLLDPPITARAADGMISLRSAGMLMTPEEFDAIAPGEWDENFRYELVHGVLVVTPFAGFGETRSNDELIRLLFEYQQTPQGKCIDDTVYEFYLRCDNSTRRVDRVIWVGLGRYPDLVQDAPTIAVEFVADSARDRKRDYEDKRIDYDQVGVKEYWVIDRFRRQMTVFRGVLEPTIVGEGEVYKTDLMPGFELPLARLLVHADRAR